MRIALVGYGKMGAALLSQWRHGEDAEDRRFFVIDPAIGQSGGEHPSASDRVRFLAEIPADETFDLVIVAVKPQLVDQVLPLYAPRIAPGGFVASIAAGCSIERLERLAGSAPVVRIMPNLPAAIGQGVSGLCAGAGVSRHQRDAVEALMTATGTTLWVEDEDRLDRLTAVAGSGPGYLFEIARCYVEAARSLGFNGEDARKLVLGTMAGTIAMALDSTERLDDLRTAVTSKNGTTAAGLNALNGDGALDRLMKATVDAAYARAVDLR